MRAASARDRIRAGRRADAQRQAARRSRRGARCGSSRERGGRGRADLLEPPFVGRDEELRLLKDLFHATGRNGASRLVSSRPGGDRQEPARLGVREVPRRDRRDRLLAPRPLPRLRRGRHLLGPRRDGPRPRRPRSRRRRGDHPRANRGDGRRVWSGRRTGAGSSRRCSTLLGVAPAPAGGRDVGAVRRVAELLRALAGRGTVVLAVRGPPVGGHRHCWTSSTTSSSGRDVADPHREPRPAGAPRASARTGAPHVRNLSRLALEPLTDEAMRELLDGFVPGLAEGQMTARLTLRPRWLRWARTGRLRRVAGFGPDDYAGGRAGDRGRQCKARAHGQAVGSFSRVNSQIPAAWRAAAPRAGRHAQRPAQRRGRPGGLPRPRPGRSSAAIIVSTSRSASGRRASASRRAW